MEFDELSKRVIGCAIEVHRELGPGLLESTDEQCLAHELKLNGIAFRLQHPQPVEYKGIRLDCGYRVDVLFDTVDHRQMRELLGRRVQDGVIARLIAKWLKAGVWEKGQVSYPEAGTPQGGVICQRPPALPFGLPAAGCLAPLGSSASPITGASRAAATTWCRSKPPSRGSVGRCVRSGNGGGRTATCLGRSSSACST